MKILKEWEYTKDRAILDAPIFYVCFVPERFERNGRYCDKNRIAKYYKQVYERCLKSLYRRVSGGKIQKFTVDGKIDESNLALFTLTTAFDLSGLLLYNVLCDVLDIEE